MRKRRNTFLGQTNYRSKTPKCKKSIAGDKIEIRLPDN
jgi:hypothetical protein